MAAAADSEASIELLKTIDANIKAENFEDALATIDSCMSIWVVDKEC